MADAEDVPDDDPYEAIEIERRQVAKILGAVSGAGAVGAFSVGAIAGLSESGKIEKPEPAFVKGTRLVDGEGNPLSVADAIPKAEDMAVQTVFAEKKGGGPMKKQRAQVLLVRFPEDSYEKPTDIDGTIDGYAAYSKVCTHLGCLVDSVDKDEKWFVCDCHGSKFDSLKGATVTDGPAPRPLPQLPIGVTDDENEHLLLATGPFEGPVGPK